MGSIAQHITTQLLMLEGVTSAPHRYGGMVTAWLTSPSPKKSVTS